MRAQNLFVLLALAVVAVLLLRKPQGAAQTAPGRSINPDDAPVVHVVEETLHQHEGEDNPIVHAFEEALEQKAHHEE